MEFGWINGFGAAIIIIMMIPNILFVVKNKDMVNRCDNRLMNVIEQIGRYACLILMWLPLLVWKFGFQSVFEMFVYIIGSGVLLIAYLIIWIFYFKKPAMKTAVALAVIPTIIFLLCGILLRHWLLVVAALLFGVGHIFVTVKNHS